MVVCEDSHIFQRKQKQKTIYTNNLKIKNYEIKDINNQNLPCDTNTLYADMVFTDVLNNKHLQKYGIVLWRTNVQPIGVSPHLLIP